MKSPLPRKRNLFCDTEPSRNVLNGEQWKYSYFDFIALKDTIWGAISQSMSFRKFNFKVASNLEKQVSLTNHAHGHPYNSKH